MGRMYCTIDTATCVVVCKVTTTLVQIILLRQQSHQSDRYISIIWSGDGRKQSVLQKLTAGKPGGCELPDPNKCVEYTKPNLGRLCRYTTRGNNPCLWRYSYTCIHVNAKRYREVKYKEKQRARVRIVRLF